MTAADPHQSPPPGIRFGQRAEGEINHEGAAGERRKKVCLSRAITKAES